MMTYLVQLFKNKEDPFYYEQQKTIILNVTILIITNREKLREYIKNNKITILKTFPK